MASLLRSRAGAAAGMLLLVAVLAATVEAKRKVVVVPTIGASVLFCNGARSWFTTSESTILNEVIHHGVTCVPPTDQQDKQSFGAAESYMSATEHMWRDGQWKTDEVKFFEALRIKLQASGWRPGVDLFGFPYDWRGTIPGDIVPALLEHLRSIVGVKLPPDDTLEQGVSEADNDDKIDIICHGGGCVVIKAAMMMRPGLAGWIRRIIALGGGWNGQISVIPWLRGVNSPAMTASTMAHVSRQSLASYDASLSHKVSWGKPLLEYSGGTFSDVASFWSHMQTIEPQTRRSAGSGQTSCSASQGELSMSLMDALDAYDPPAWVTILSYYGVGTATAIGGKWDVAASRFFDTDPTPITIDGDGVVPSLSAKQFNSDGSKPTEANFLTKEYKLKHNELIKDPQIVRDIVAALNADDATLLAALAAAALLGASGGSYAYRRRKDKEAARKARRERRAARKASGSQGRRSSMRSRKSQHSHGSRKSRNSASARRKSKSSKGSRAASQVDV